MTAATPDPKEPDDTAAAAVVCVPDCLLANTAGPVAGASIVCARCLPSRGNTVLGNSPDTPDSPDAPHVSPARHQVVAVVPVPEVKLPPVPQEVALAAAPAAQADPAAPTVRRPGWADWGRPTTFPAPPSVAPSAPLDAHDVKAEVAALLRYICLAAFEVRDEDEDVGGEEADDDDDEADADHDGAPRPEPRPVRSLEVMPKALKRRRFKLELGCLTGFCDSVRVSWRGRGCGRSSSPCTWRRSTCVTARRSWPMPCRCGSLRPRRPLRPPSLRELRKLPLCVSLRSKPCKPLRYTMRCPTCTGREVPNEQVGASTWARGSSHSLLPIPYPFSLFTQSMAFTHLTRRTRLTPSPPSHPACSHHAFLHLR